MMQKIPFVDAFPLPRLLTEANPSSCVGPHLSCNLLDISMANLPSSLFFTTSEYTYQLEDWKCY